MSVQTKVLVISIQCWPIPARIALSLSKVGFIVGSISPSGSFIRRTRAVHRHYTFRSWAPANSIIHAIEDWSPDCLVCTDDEAVKELHYIHFRATNGPAVASSVKLSKLIETSLGDPKGFEFSRKKSKLIFLAKSLGLRCPPTVEISSKDVTSQLDTVTYPILVKGDGLSAGEGIRIVENARQARRAIHELQLPPNWPTVLKAFVTWFSPTLIVKWICRDLPAVCIQDFIVGCDGNRAVACWQGEVLAGISVRVHETIYAFGAAALVEIIESPEMTDTVNVLVKTLNLSGIIGFDFVLDSANRAWLIEINPRVTPVSYLGCSNTNLSAALFSKVKGIGLRSQLSSVDGKLIALFPQELERSPHSEFISPSYDDVPWEEPELVLALIKEALKDKGGALNRLRMRRRNRRNSLIQILQRKAVITYKNMKTINRHSVKSYEID
jgi:hypothetical protein